ncbi:MAG: YitT family protein, partial [Clostridia bacterium]|nr:YitT family protein [Clostridia bacterium]
MKKAKPYILDFSFILVGCFVLALGINVFLAPNMISSGGISSVGTILLHLFGVDL